MPLCHILALIQQILKGTSLLFQACFEDFSLSELVPYQLISKKQSQEHDEMKFSKKNLIITTLFINSSRLKTF